MQNENAKLNVQKNIQIKNFTQDLIFLHKPGLRGLLHLKTLNAGNFNDEIMQIFL